MTNKGHVPQKPFQPALDLILLLSGTLLEGLMTIILKDIPSFGAMIVLMIADQHVSLKSLFGVQLG